ncbi:MAG: T9SS type A sorting domain-containing protein [Bacteroidota bacterium]|nr:T9SS type A sorting domain-containing protein [Bacteroidota bacterium]
MKRNCTNRAIRSINILLNAILLIIFYGYSNYAVASHVAGADISYECTSTPGVYNITLKVYRDCSEAQLCASCPGGLSSNCVVQVSKIGASGTCSNTVFGTQTLTLITAISSFDIVQLCDTSKSICSNCGTRTPGSFSPGIEVYVFKGEINLNSLPSGCCMVSIGYSSCCRNAAIISLLNPGTLNFYTEATINRCITPCNSAPIFTNAPVAVVCAGQDYYYNPGALDPDGDSLSYAFRSALIYHGVTAPYVSPYSPTVPIPYLGAPIQGVPLLPPAGISFDPITGDIRFRPLGFFIATMVIEVKQWKNMGGVPTLMGVTRRDIQFYSILCPNNNPPIHRTYDANATLSSPQPNFAYSVCAGQQLCFYVTAWDNAASTDTTDLSWNAPSNLVSNGATFVKAYNASTRITTGPRLDSMRFCWTPPASMAQNLPYYFVVNAKDRACPLPGRTSRSFSILVRRIPLATITKTNKGCRKYDFAYSLYNGVAVDSSYTQFQVETAPHSNNYITYNGSSVSNHTFMQGGYHQIKLRMRTMPPPAPNGCANDNIYDSILITSPVQASIGDTSVCFGQSVKLQAHGSGGVPFGLGYRYSFYAGDLSSSTIIRALNPDSNIIINASAAGNMHYKVVITDSNGCSDSTIFTINTGSPLPHEMTTNMRLCYGMSDTLDAGNNNGSVINWHWFKSPALPAMENIFSQKIIAKDSGRYVVQKMDSMGCIHYDIAMVYVNPAVQLSAGSDRSLCSNNALLSLIANGTTAAIDSFQWRQLPVIDPAIILARTASLTIAPGVNTSYQVKGFITYGGVTCSNTDTVSVLVKPSPIINHPADISICKNTGMITLPVIISTNKPGQITWAWTYPLNPSAISGNQVITANLLNQPASPPSNAAGNFVNVTVSDSDGCKVKDSLIIAIFPRPVINAGPHRQFCDYAGTFNITPGTQLYTPNGGAMAINELWLGNGIFKPNAGQNYYAFNPQATGVKIDTNIITYKFIVTYPLSNTVVFNPALSGYTAPSPTGGCLASDTVIFDVIQRPNAIVITGQKTALRTDTSYTYSVLSQVNVSYVWTITNGTINAGQGTASVNVTWTNSGSGSIKVEGSNQQNCNDSNLMNVTVISTGMNEMTQFQTLQIFPNPNNGNFIVSAGIIKSGNYSIQIFNALGDIVYTLSAGFKPGKNDMEIELPRVSGIYFLRISDTHFQQVKRFVIE